MTKFHISAGALALGLGLAGPAVAGNIEIHDAYFRTARPGAPTGAAFLEIMNTGEAADRLVSASSPIAPRVELHTHIHGGDGVMAMRRIEGGIAVPAGGMAVLQSGGDHVMFMGLSAAYATGDSIPLTLVFEGAGAITVEVAVDNERMPATMPATDGMDGMDGMDGTDGANQADHDHATHDHTAGN